MNIDTWLITNLDQIGLRSHQLSWIKEFFPTYDDFSSEITVGERKYFGRGTKIGPDLSLLVSIVECLERAIALSAGRKTSNGIAAHTSLESAKKAARNELVERDLFLSHYRCYRPLISDDKLIRYVPQNARGAIYSRKCDVSFYRMASNNIGDGVVCKISGRSVWGGILGLSFGDFDEIENTTVNSFMEAFRQYWHLESKNLLTESQTLEEFASKKSWQFEDHRKLSLDVNYFDSIQWLFNSNHEEPLSIEYAAEKFQYQEVNSPLPIFSECPLKVVQCTSSDCQNLDVGPTSIETIKSLTKFLTEESKAINMLPHPLS
jgi:hypothetical protein